MCRGSSPSAVYQVAQVYGAVVADAPGQLAVTAAQLVTGAASVVFVAERAAVAIGMAGPRAGSRITFRAC